MSIVVRFEPESLTTEQYDESVRRLEEAGEIPADGLDYHVSFTVNGKLVVSEIWDSREKFEAFGEKLMPVLGDVGIDPGEPKVLEVHNIIKR